MGGSIGGEASRMGKKDDGSNWPLDRKKTFDPRIHTLHTRIPVSVQQGPFLIQF